MSLRFMAHLAAGLLAASVTHAQPPPWPGAKPVTLIVPFATGGNLDATARLLGQKLSERLKQSVIVENVAGAGGTIGVDKAIRAAPDGYTLLLGADSPVAIARHVNPAGVKYDGLKDLLPAGLATTAPLVIVACPGMTAGSLADVIRLAIEKPGQLSYATSGVGSVLQLAMELVKNQSKTFMVHVPYRGGAQIVTDVIGNQIDLAVLVSVTATPHIIARRITGIAVTSERRLAVLPNVAAVAETAGFKGFEIVSWTGLFLPARTPASIVERLNRELMDVLRNEDVKAKLADGGALPGSGTADDFARFVRKEEARYAVIVKAANIRE